MGQRRAIDLAVATPTAAAVVLYVALDVTWLDHVLYLGVFVLAAATAWVGAARAPAEYRLVGRLIAAGITLTAVGDATWEFLDSTGRGTDVSLADPPWLASYVLLCIALSVVLRRSGAGRHDLDFTIDAVTIVIVSVLVLWGTAIDTIVTDASLAVQTRVAWSMYPMADAILLALVVRVLTSRPARQWLHPSFAAGALLWLTADVAFLQPAGAGIGLVMDVCWMIAPVLMALSVWRLRGTPPRTVGQARRAHPVFQLGIAIGPLLVPPAIELLRDLRGQDERPLMLLLGTTSLAVLAFIRMARLLRSEERAVRELETARDDALAASRAKSMFLATMSHEIRTPLTMVLGAGEVLDDTPLDDLQRELVARMRRSGHALRSLVDDVLDFSRIEAGQLEVARVPFDLATLVDDLAERCRPRAEVLGISYESVLDPAVPRRVEGDPDRLLQVVGNLLDNAVKFTHEGHVRLHVRPAPDGRVELTVSDTGIGIAEEDLEAVFESFHQVDGSTTRRYGGAGLGLAIAKELTALMGGTLEVTSTVGSGSEFTVLLPLPAADDAAGGVGRGGRRGARQQESRTAAPTSG